MPSRTGSYAASTIFDVRDKVVVITGGGTGLGRFFAEGFVENGAKVWIIGRRKEVLERTVREIKEMHGSTARISLAQGDLASKDGVRAIIDQISDAEERVDVLVNNAAIQKPWKNPISNHLDPDAIERLVWEGVDDEDWNATNANPIAHERLVQRAANVNGIYFMTAGLVPLLRKSEDPSVIIISSIASIANQRPVSTLTYGVSKAAANHLAAMLAGRLAPLKIRVNTILPGTFPTEITARRDENGEMKLLPGPETVARRTPLGRAGSKEEIFGPVLLLASRAGSYMTNAVISVDGGRNLNAGIDDGIRLPDNYYH